VQGLLHVAICSLAAWLWGLEGAFGGLLLSAIVRWYIYHRALRLESGAQSITIRYQEPWRERDIIRRFAVPAAISGLTSMPALWLANTFLVSQKDGYAQMGLYSAANNLKAIIMFLPALLNNVGTSLLNNQKGLGNDVLYRRIFWTNFRITAAAVVLGAGLMFGAGSWLLALFGKDFPEGEPVLRLLTLSVLFEALALASYQVIQSKEKMWFSLFAVALPRDLLIASLSFLFAPLYGAFGLAMAHTIAWSVALLIIIAGVLRFGLHTRSRLPLAGTHE
jgi:O-antigen/teichoic acid export membrane protein